MSTEVRVPTLGESVTEATVATWFKKPGDSVAVDEMLCELETDKVTVEVPSPASGTLGEIVAAEGATVGVDALLATISEGAAKGNGEDKPAEKPEAEPKDDAPARQESAKGGASVDVMVPALGESVTEATVSTWFKAEGDLVQLDEMLCELETDKVSVEVPAPAAGTLTKILAKEGDTVAAGGKLAVLDSDEGRAVQSVATPKEVPDEDKVEPSSDGKDVEHAPSAKKLMAEHGLTAAQVTGTGKDGRIMKEDVQKAIAEAGAAPAKSEAPAAAPQPAAKAPPRAPVPAEDAAREEPVKMTRLRQTIARRLKDAQNTAAMLTTYNEVDMGAVMDIRNAYKDQFEKKHGVKTGFLSFFTKACCYAMKEVPEVNAEMDVPMADMQGGTVTLSNGGVYVSLISSPRLNPAHSGILGMHKIQQRPMVVDGQIVARPMMYLALSYDHRIVDGKGAVTFLVRVKEALEDPRRLLMDL